MSSLNVVKWKNNCDYRANMESFGALFLIELTVQCRYSTL